MALPFTPDMVRHVQAKFDLGADRRPDGSSYSPIWVGERFWASYFRTVADRLKPGGRALIQSITISEALFERYRTDTDFIQQYINYFYVNSHLVVHPTCLNLPVVNLVKVLLL